MKNQVDQKPSFVSVSPRLPVADVEEALRYYIDRLGFSPGWTWGSPMTHANVCRDAICLDLVSAGAGRCGTAMVYVQLTGVDPYFAELRARQVDAMEPQDRPYGMRDFEVVDPDGNRIAFGEPR